MISKKRWILINISLSFVIILLLLNFFGFKLPSLGQAFYLLDSEDPLCIVDSKEGLTVWPDLRRCCLEAKKQVECLRDNLQLQEGNLDWKCQTNEYIPKIRLNNKAFSYCRQQPVW